MRRRQLVMLTLLGFAPAVPALAQRPSLGWTVTEWQLPTPRSLPHDPAAAPDGSLWYTAYHGNKLGRVDPVSGVIREFPLPTPKSGPQGLLVDQNGNVWYTASSRGRLGMLDARTGRITEHKIDDPRGWNAHTPVLAENGLLWFTILEGNAIGRFDPGSKDFTLTSVPTPRAKPYGIAIDSRGVPYFCEFGANRLGSIDPTTLQITEYPLPNPDARPRRLAIAADDSLYYTDDARGYLSHFFPKTGKVREWFSPSGKASRPYAITITRDGMVWYSESGVEPNTIVRFDPKTEEFRVEAVPSGGGLIRNMVAGPEGRVYLAESGVNKVAMIEPARASE
jgi:virginiamycin B lyase